MEEYQTYTVAEARQDHYCPAKIGRISDMGLFGACVMAGAIVGGTTLGMVIRRGKRKREESLD